MQLETLSEVIPWQLHPHHTYQGQNVHQECAADMRQRRCVCEQKLQSTWICWKIGDMFCTNHVGALGKGSGKMQ